MIEFNKGGLISSRITFTFIPEMTTSSPSPGSDPPCHVVVSDQSKVPVVPVLVIVRAATGEDTTSSAAKTLRRAGDVNFILTSCLMFIEALLVDIVGECA